jgi:TonB-dependent receptor
MGCNRPGEIVTVLCRRTTGTRLVAVLAGLVLLFTIAGPAPAQQGAVGGIRGSVYDLDIGVPLARARVTVVEANLSTLTSDEGTFVFESVAPGSYTVTVSKEGFERQVITDVVVTAGRMADLRVDLSTEVFEMPELVVTGEDVLSDSEIGVLELRMESVAVQDALSSELINRAGATNVAGALSLVVGASVVEGKYATVRGLSDRYTGTTLNGIRVPSADPRKRAVQIDLFPVGTVENVTVTKTFTPDLQGDFTGGGVDIRTKSIPDGRFLTARAQVWYDTSATGNPRFLTYEGGGVDPWGFDRDGSRRLPDVANQFLPNISSIRFQRNTTAADMQRSTLLDEATRAFTPVMGVTTEAPGPNYEFQIAGGNRHSLGGDRLFGWVGALTYKREYDFYENGINNNVVVETTEGTPGITKERVDNRGTDELLIGALANFVLQPNPDHSLSLKLILNQSAQDQARIQTQFKGQNESTVNYEQNQSLRYLERTVASTQMHGQHFFPSVLDEGMSLDWVISTNFTRQDEPDTRFFLNAASFDFAQGLGSADDQTGSGGSAARDRTRRIWREGVENNLIGRVDLTLPFTQWTSTRGDIKAGLFSDRTDRDYDQRSFTYVFNQQGCCTPPGRRPRPWPDAVINDPERYPEWYEYYVLQQSRVVTSSYVMTAPDDLWTNVFLDPDRIGLARGRESDWVADNQLLWVAQDLFGDDVEYTGEQTIDAFYSMARLPLGPTVNLIGGARFEATNISIVPVSPDGVVEVIRVRFGSNRELVRVPQELAVADIEDMSTLPSLGVIWEIVPNMKLRASASRTVARPTFRELAPVATEEFIDGDEFVGNPNLRISKITNYDARWEWFRRPGEVLAVSAFYKNIQDPIEFISFAAANRTFVQPVNFERGRLLGLEFEARTAFDVFAPGLRGLAMGVNYAYIDSEVDVPEEEQEGLADFKLDEPTRRLQGQPDYVFNVNLTWDNPDTKTSAGIFYNRIGEILFAGSARVFGDPGGGIPDVFEQPFGTLNVNVTQGVGSGFKVAFFGKNLLQQNERSLFRTPAGEELVKEERTTPARYSIALIWNW